ncbi:MAG: N-acetyltransferase [Parvularculales bacterium]
MNIRRAKEADVDRMWQIMKPVIAGGDTYTFEPDASKSDVLSYWMNDRHHVFVAVEGQDIWGTYMIKDNQPGPGSHVANAGFMVSPRARSRGVGYQMGEHALLTAKELGYKFMQFNMVVSTNEPAVALWQKLGFEIIGALPKSFNHKHLGLTDAYVMYREL